MKKKTKEEYLAQANKLWDNRYTYDLSNYKNGLSKIRIYCSKHDLWFEKKAKVHIINKQGCPKCGKENSIKKQTKTNAEFIAEVNVRFNGFFYTSKTKYINAKTNVTITCPIHGDFNINPKNFLKSKKGCPKCSFENMASTFTEFQSKANTIHSNKFNYRGDYKNNKTEIEIICPTHGSFFQRPDSHLNGHGCPKCFKNVSKAEIEISDFLSEHSIRHKTSDKKVLNGLELDIVIPDKHIAIEYNGLFWHREGLYRPVRNKCDKNYHLNKTNLANSAGYNLIHIFEDEWVNKKNIVATKLLHILGKSKGKKIGARQCTINPIDYNTARVFLDEFHIQGADSAGIRYGAFYGDTLVGVMTFLKGYKLNRYATNNQYRIVGLASKMLKRFVRDYKPKVVTTFADKRFTLSPENNVYTKLGFNLVGHTKPAYHYYNVKTQEIKRYNRQNFMKHKLLKKHPKFTGDLTEKQMMISLGFDRVWDCGNFKYEKTYEY